MPNINTDIKIEKMNLLITNKCNIWCKMCDYRMYRLSYKDLSLEQLKHLIDEAYNIGVKVIELSGGEPMVREDIYEIISHAKSLGIIVRLFTNGTLIGEIEVVRLINAGLSDIVISLEGFAEINDKLRGKGNYQKALNALNIFMKYKRNLEHIKVAVTVSKYNYNQLFNFAKFLIENIGVTKITYQPFNKNMLHCKKHKNLDDFIISYSHLPELNREIKKIIEFSKMFNHKYVDEDQLRKISNYFNGMSMVPINGCLKPSKSFSVDPNGRVYACAMKNECIGNVTILTLKEIITSKKYNNVNIKALNNKCEGCI